MRSPLRWTIPLALAACTGSDDDTDPVDTDVTDTDVVDTDLPPGTNVPGRYDHVIDVGGLESTFTVYVPASAAGDTPAPVVMMFHGTSQDSETFFDESGWVAKADEVGLIAVFPQGLTYCYREDENGDGDFVDAGERRVSTKWGSSGLGDPTIRPLCDAADLADLEAGPRALADHPLRDDVLFFDRMLETLATEHAIDRQRVYATGFSNGGQMTARLAGDRSEVLAAAAGSGATMEGTPVAAPRPMSYLLSIGELDDRFTPINGGDPLPLDESLMTPAVLASGMVKGFLTTLSLTDAYTYSEGKAAGKRFVQFEFATSTAGADNSFRIAVLEGLYHQYPNGNNYPIDAADVLWDQLFSQRTLAD